nr:penicillin-binding protein [Lachnospiraceae bacterium]
MLGNIRDKLVLIVTSRLFYVAVVLVILFSILVQRLFVLQIIRGESYNENFTLRIKREKILSGTRGTIFDRNGVILAEDKLAYSVTIEDNYDSNDTKNKDMNDTIYRLIRIIEGNGDKLDTEFNIYLDENDEFTYAVSGRSKLRFIADVLGQNSTEDLLLKEQNMPASDLMEYLCSKERFGIGSYIENARGGYDFIPMEGYTNTEILKLVSIRYAMSLNSYQKFIATIVAADVNERTVAEVMENKIDLQGVDVVEDTVREYINDPSMSHILGYTGKISEEELVQLNASSSGASEADNYILNDMVGKSGIEQVEEKKLQGKKGKQTIFVDNLGRVTETGETVDPQAGSNLYLTIDSNLQRVVYKLLEQKIAGIVVSKLRDVKDYDPEEENSAANIIIPMDDVYFSLFDNNVISIPHLSSSGAGVYEKKVHEAYLVKLESVISLLDEELKNNKTVYNELDEEMRKYETYVVTMLQNQYPEIFMANEVDPGNEIYIKWKAGELPLTDYLREAIARGWININNLGAAEQYLNSDEIFEALVSYTEEKVRSDTGFAKCVFEYMIKDSEINGNQICHILYEQEKLIDKDNQLGRLDSGEVTAFEFMKQRLTNLEITPAQLALDPCSGSTVITDVKTGEVIACVSYPSYDNNRLANTIDADYYNSLTIDKSLPLYDYATQQKTAPGSTFKPVTSTAGLEEGVISTGERINCVGVYDRIDPTRPPKCWIYPNGTHGELDIVGAIENSCNYFFYEVGYRLSLTAGYYNSDVGISKIAKYADLYGLS